MIGASETSEATQQVIDQEVRRIIDTAHDEVAALLTAHRDQLQKLALALLEAETLDEADAYTVSVRRRGGPGAVLAVLEDSEPGLNTGALGLGG